MACRPAWAGVAHRVDQFGIEPDRHLPVGIERFLGLGDFGVVPACLATALIPMA